MMNLSLDFKSNPNMDENENNESRASDFPEISSGMFGSRFIIGGISITPIDCPSCFEVGYTLNSSQCHFCEFYAQSDCPFRHDPTILHDAFILFGQNKRYWQIYQERREARLEAIYSELKGHGRPLHFEVLTRIIRDRYPHMHLNSRMIVHYLGRHPEMFEWVDRGVFRAR